MSFLTLYALACHFAGDFPLQTDWMAANKFDDWLVRWGHCSVYSVCFTPFVYAAGYTFIQSVAFIGLLFSTHFAIDSKRWNEAVPIWYDQALHIIALAMVVAITEGVF